VPQREDGDVQVHRKYVCRFGISDTVLGYRTLFWDIEHCFGILILALVKDAQKYQNVCGVFSSDLFEM
jgi:hypothetical protein